MIACMPSLVFTEKWSVWISAPKIFLFVIVVVMVFQVNSSQKTPLCTEKILKKHKKKRNKLLHLYAFHSHCPTLFLIYYTDVRCENNSGPPECNSGCKQSLLQHHAFFNLFRLNTTGPSTARFPHSSIHLSCMQLFVYWKQYTER